MAEEAWRRDPHDRWSRTGVAVAANRLGDLLLEARDVRESASRFREAIRIASRLVKEDPQYQYARLELASAEHGLGRALLTLGTSDAVAEGCAALHRVETIWIELRSKGGLPANETEDLDRLAGWLARCPSRP